MKTSPQLQLMRNRGFGLLWTAGLISMTGNWLLRVALPIYIYQLSGSVTATATAVAVQVGVSMIGAPIAGALVDRWDRKQVMIWVNLLHAVALLPLLVVDSAAELWIAYLAIAIQSGLSLFVIPAEHSLLPRLVPEADLPAANGLNALNNNIARLLGPALGGVVAATMGLAGTVLLDGVSFLIAAGLAALIPGAHRAVSAAPKHLLREIADGAKVIAASVPLRALFAVIAVSAIGEGIMASLFPAFVADSLHGDVTLVGALMSAQAIGGIVGGLACGFVSQRLSPQVMLTIGLVVFGLIDLAIFNYPRWFEAIGPVVAMFILVGIPSAIMGAAWLTMLQTEVADEMRARVISAVLVIESIAGLLGAGTAGWLTQRFGVVNVLTGQGAAYVLSALVFVAAMRRRPKPLPAVPKPDLASVN